MSSRSPPALDSYKPGPQNGSLQNKLDVGKGAYSGWMNAAMSS